MSVILPLADGPGTPVDVGISEFLLLAAILFGWFAIWRLRGKAFRGVPRALAWAAAALASIALILAFVLPPIITPSGRPRPSSSAHLAILSPHSGEVFQAAGRSLATIPVRLRLTGGRIVAFTSTKLVPNEGHVHLFVDGALVSMSLALDKEVLVPLGEHTIRAEFVATDHAPFDPRVTAAVSFRVAP
jgi:hypothetical protein